MNLHRAVTHIGGVRHESSRDAVACSASRGNPKSLVTPGTSRAGVTRVGFIIATLAVLNAPAASACGGFFCNAADPSVIVQAGERVIFSQEGGLTTMHVEVVYGGQPTEFGWILPLPDVPKDASGQPLPLDKAVELSHEAAFDRLQTATTPQYRVTRSGSSGDCDGGDSFSDGADASDASDSGDPNGGVTVLQEASVGPYTAQLIQATNAKMLYEWLNENGYTQDPAAEPLLSDYVAMDFVFVGLRLKNGDAAGKLPPISIRVGETAACVPLRLTSIAATANMPILVWVLGEARAVPKNFMHVVLNPQAVSWPGAPQYQDVLNEAVDNAVGHGFITESAQPASDFAGLFQSKQQQAGAISWPADAIEVLGKYESLGLPFDATFTSIATEVTGWDGLDGIDGLRAHLSGVADSQPWIAAIEARILEPLGRIQAMFDRANVVTRLYTTVDPEDMTRDPIFVFNPDLPLVSPINIVKGNWVDGGCFVESVSASWPNGATYSWDCGETSCPSFGSIPAIAGEPAVLRIEVIDESGPPVQIALADVAAVDSVLAAAKPGSPSLPGGYPLSPRPPGSGDSGAADGVDGVDGADGADDGGSEAVDEGSGGAAGGGSSSGCSATQPWEVDPQMAALGLLMMAAFFWRRGVRQ